MAWTPWRKVADEADWYVDHCLRIPVCYELALAKLSDRREPEVVYVGAAVSEASELERLAAGEHPIRARIDPRLAGGHGLYYRATGAPTLAGAQALQAARLERVTPPLWNR